MAGIKNKHFNLLSLNVRGIRNKEKRDAILLWSKHQKTDILLLQESYWTDDILKIIRNEWKGQVFVSNGSNHARGVAILISKDFPITISNIICGQEGRMIMLNATINSYSLCIVNIYAPTEKKYRERFFKKLYIWIESNKLPDHDLVIGGDFNSILCPTKDVKRNPNAYYKTPRNLKFLIKRFDLCDMWRHFNPHKRQFTWRNIFLNVASRLDYWLVTDSLKAKIMMCDIRPSVRCDHNAIFLKVLIGKLDKGPGYWKLNTYILNDDLYKNKVRQIIKSIERMNLSFCERWELTKIKCREYTQKYCARKKCKAKELKRILEEKFVNITRTIDEQSYIDDVTKKEYLRIESALDDLYKRECKGASVRSRVKWLEKGEKNTKYFMRLEKNNAQKRNITRLRKGNKIITKRAQILNEVVSFYEKLYASKQVQKENMEEYFESSNVSKLTESDKKLCEGLLTYSECREAVFKMSKNKAPGGDGLSLEFYQEFWNDIEFMLVNALNENFCNKVMSKTQRLGIITLIHKKGETEDLNNWRPITLLNYDYKIMAAVLANRLHKVLPKLIHDNQVGYIKNRMSGFNIRLTQDVFDYMKKCNLEGALMLVDFRKAFDTVEFDFIEHCLRKFDFDEDFRCWVKLMYEKVESSVLINGWRTKRFQISRGIRQGCPLSAMLFILAVEILAERIRKNDKIKGVLFGNNDRKELKILQYADDTSVFLREKSSMKYILDELDKFGNVAGPVVNKDKTMLKWLGSAKNHWNYEKYGLHWTTGCIKYLGVHIDHDLEKVVKLNWETKLQKIQRIVDNWRKRNLTIVGRVLIIKTLLISQIVHLIMFCPVPNYVVKKLENIIYHFLWNSKVDKIKRAKIVKDYEDGGIRMINIQTLIQSFRLKWLARIFDDTCGFWKEFALLYFEALGGFRLILNCTMDNVMVEKWFVDKLPRFYVEMIQAWSHLKEFIKKDDLYSNTQILWYNKYIVYDNKPLFYRDWYASTIIFLKDICTEGKFVSLTKLKENFSSEKTKAKALFDYSKLQRAIPRVWMNNLKDTSTLDIPTIPLREKEKQLQFCSSKLFYDILLTDERIDDGPAYWANLVNNPIDWKTVFQRNLKNIKENKLKQFNLKLLYNLIPTKRKLFLWQLSNSDTCEVCNTKEDLIHAFLYCKLNLSFFEKLFTMVKRVYKVDPCFDVNILLKNYKEKQIDDIITIALWSIYKMLILRNEYGKEERKKKLWFTFLKELKLRIHINNAFLKKGKKEMYNLPAILEMYF